MKCIGYLSLNDESDIKCKEATTAQSKVQHYLGEMKKNYKNTQRVQPVKKTEIQGQGVPNMKQEC